MLLILVCFVENLHDIIKTFTYRSIQPRTTPLAKDLTSSFDPFSNLKDIHFEQEVKSAYAKFTPSKILRGLVCVMGVVLALLGLAWLWE